MSVNAIEVAAWIVICVAVRRLLSELIMAGHERREKLAIVAEYQDERTTDQRKEQLLLRFPEVIVRSPDLKYFKIAAEEYKANGPTHRERIRDWSLTLGAIALGWVLYLGAKYGLAYAFGLFHGQ